MANTRWERDTSELMQSVTAQHLPSTGFLPLDLSHLCLHSHISRFCHGSHLPAIMWKKHRKRATCISSTLFFLQPSCALNKWTKSHAEDKQPNPHPREATGKLPQASGDFVPQDQKPADPTHEPQTSLLPNCFMLQSPGPPWQFKSKSASPVLPVTPTAPGGINLITLELCSSFTFKHKV